MNNSVLWSNSITKDILTEYAEGLACNNFDRRILYHVRQISQYKWMVIYKKHVSGQNKKLSSELMFQRVRTVTIDTDGYMTCTCGYVQRMLMPCTHICAIIGDIEYYEPSMFHIRWYKMFNYYYRDKERNICCTKTNTAIEDLLQVTRANAYHSNGKYKGIHVKGTKFYTRCQSFHTCNDITTKLLESIAKRVSDYGPIKMDNAMSLEEFEEREATMKELVPSNNANDIHENDISMAFGGSSQVEGNLSQNAQLYSQDDYRPSIKEESFYNTALPLFNDMINTCQNDESFQECLQLMRTQISKNLASNSKPNEELNTGSVHLYGENMTSRKSVKRHKSTGEKIFK